MEQIQAGRNFTDLDEDDQNAILAVTEELRDLIINGEVPERFELVEFNGEKIHRFELEALNAIVKEVNADFAEQRRQDPKSKFEDIDIDKLIKRGLKVSENKLVQISFSDLPITKIPPSIGELENLQRLYLSGTNVQDIQALANLTNLQELYLGVTKVQDIQALANLTNLQKLDLIRNEVQDIQALANLTNLQKLWLGETKVQDIQALANLTNLQLLWLSRTKVQDIQELEKLINLETLYLHDCSNLDQTTPENKALIAKLRARIKEFYI
jgi:Leucine-rich repeat (LRR) protein